MPEFGDTKGQQVLRLISIILFFVGLIEGYGTILYLFAFDSATTDACCGFIAETSQSEWENVFPCQESSIEDGHIPREEISGAVLCELNGVLCDRYTVSGETTSLQGCLATGGYSLSDMCGSDVMYLEGAGASNAAKGICYCALFFAIVTSIYCLTDFFQCNCGQDCETKSCQGCCFCVQLVMFILLLILMTNAVEDASNNGYDATWSSTDAGNYVQEECIDIETIWVEYSIETDAFIESVAFNIITIGGTILTVIELLMLCKQYSS